jgi:hypothetical protein
LILEIVFVKGKDNAKAIKRSCHHWRRYL